MKIWVTKYALSRGILEQEGEVVHDHPTMFRVRMLDGITVALYSANEWFKTRAEAVKRVRVLIQAKRQSIGKQLKNLDRLEQELNRPSPGAKS